jgi:hypothetical protein
MNDSIERTEDELAKLGVVFDREARSDVEDQLAQSQQALHLSSHSRNDFFQGYTLEQWQQESGDEDCPDYDPAQISSLEKLAARHGINARIYKAESLQDKLLSAGVDISKTDDMKRRLYGSSSDGNDGASSATLSAVGKARLVTAYRTLLGQIQKIKERSVYAPAFRYAARIQKIDRTSSQEIGFSTRDELCQFLGIEKHRQKNGVSHSLGLDTDIASQPLSAVVAHRREVGQAPDPKKPKATKPRKADSQRELF